MKNTFNIFLTSLVIIIYFLIATSTSTDKDFNYIEGNIVNTSDTCNVSSLQLIYAVTGNNDDTLIANAQLIPPSDSAFIFTDSLSFHTLLYLCSCGDTAYFESTPFVQGPTSVFPTIEVDCD